MKSLPLSRRVLLVPVALAFAASLSAQSGATPPALGLLRLKSTAKANDAVPLAAGKFSVDELSAAGVSGSAKGKKNNVDYLALEAGKAWSRPLRRNPDLMLSSLSSNSELRPYLVVRFPHGVTAHPSGPGEQSRCLGRFPLSSILPLVTSGCSSRSSGSTKS